MKTKKKYVENVDMIIELKKLKKTDSVTSELHEMFLLMSSKISLKAMYKDKPYRSDMIHAAYIKCVTKAHMFDLNKTNPFAYFQSMIENYFKDHIYKYEKDRQFLAKLSIKTHQEIAEKYNLAFDSEEINLNSEQNIGPINNIYWRKTFINFLLLPTEKYPTLNLKIQNYFVDEIAEQLIKTNGFEIIYLNTDCDNINGHCICENCDHLQFENKYGKLIMDHRQVLFDIKGMQ